MVDQPETPSGEEEPKVEDLPVEPDAPVTEHVPEQVEAKEYYSPSTRGWYGSHVHKPEFIPADAIEIPLAEKLALFAGQAQGKEIVPGRKGWPMLADPLPRKPE